MLKSVFALGAAAVLALSPGLVSASPTPRALPGQVALGAVHPVDLGCGVDGMTFVQPSSATVPFQVPGAGVLTSWSTYANAGAGKARMLAVVPTTVGGWFSMVGKAALADVTPNTVNTFDTRVPVPAGAVLGLYVTKSEMNCFYVGPELTAGDVMMYSVFFDPDLHSYFQSLGLQAKAQVSVSAVWEPDVDADGFGDITQDACLQSALSQVTCPPAETKVKRKPQKVSTDRTISMKLKSAAGATFTCAVDGGKAKPCTSPYKKTFKYGKHTIVVTAVSAVGIPDPTPVELKFRVVRPSATDVRRS
jgi:hypothetical protein